MWNSRPAPRPARRTGIDRCRFAHKEVRTQPQADLLAPGHPLLDVTVDVVLERFQPLLAQGAVLVDDGDPGTVPHLLVYLEHAIRYGRVTKSGEPRGMHQRLQFILLAEDGTATGGGAAPYLDCRPITPEEWAPIDDVITAPWPAAGVEDRALGLAIANPVPAHLAETKRCRLAEIDKMDREVHTGLNREIICWDRRGSCLREEERAGKEQRINAANADTDLRP